MSLGKGGGTGNDTDSYYDKRACVRNKSGPGDISVLAGVTSLPSEGVIRPVFQGVLPGAFSRGDPESWAPLLRSQPYVLIDGTTQAGDSRLVQGCRRDCPWDDETLL